MAWATGGALCICWQHRRGLVGWELSVWIMGRLAKCYEYGEEVARSKQSAAPPMTSLTVLLGNGGVLAAVLQKPLVD